MTPTEYQPDVMLYHANCADGFGAAWAAWMKWGDAVDYRPVSYGQEPPADLAEKHVLIGDFSFKREVMQRLGREAGSIIVLDHHKSAETELEPWIWDDVSGEFWAGDDPMKAVRFMDEYVGQPVAANFDMERSGARMVWEFCHAQPVPRLIELIEDRDLWRFNFEDTKPFGLWLRSEPFDFQRWEIISQQLDDGRDGHQLLSEARAMQRFYDQKVSEIAALARTGEVGGQLVPVCNCPPMFASEVGHKLLDDHPEAPFVACYSDQGKSRGYSLRSRDDRMDVSDIARKYGGGGHRNAAGFGVPIP
ncbi:DHHA1 domain-containing protein [uncultured Sphingopyxis sp.]|jgi:oligoribonuclease NrnB/cAMP/cGMP phosphodiesterase (DHH superfamily)|uniref:DHHA1 domain-containing protein n=1 Tax=uncultured Sphingopyxis sp. TaxID=310581 RepID=UPI002597167F|nr:DHHA1 domain-containing protein [uncultured Sphingopyxis sp.]